VAAWTSEMSMSYNEIIWHHNPEELNLNLYCHKTPNLETIIFIEDFGTSNSD
jgi:hypothetical protein